MEFADYFLGFLKLFFVAVVVFVVAVVDVVAVVFVFES